MNTLDSTFHNAREAREWLGRLVHPLPPAEAVEILDGIRCALQRSTILANGDSERTGELYERYAAPLVAVLERRGVT